MRRRLLTEKSQTLPLFPGLLLRRRGETWPENSPPAARFVNRAERGDWTEVANIAERHATIVYDGECPFCTAYVRLIRLRAAVGPVALVDMRRGGPEVEEAVAAGYDLDEGMVLKLDDKFYHGDACLNRLALMSTRSDAFNRFTAFLFGQPAMARLAYPLLRGGRNLTLRILRRAQFGSASAARPRDCA